MLLTALVESPEHVCCRYRLAAFRPFLEQSGHALELRAWPRRWWSRIRLYRELLHAAVIIQRRLLPSWELALLRRSVRLLLFDYDDAVFLRDSYARKGLESSKRISRFSAMVRAADAVIAGNVFLSDRALRCGAVHVRIIPTCMDPGHYPKAEHVHVGAEVKLVWVGSASTLRGLEAVRPLLETLGRECGPGLCLKLICDRFLALRDLRVLACPWSAATEAGEIASGDIGISWLPDDAWSRGKCGLKVLQYMAAGLPVVANPVGVQAELVRHGETGFLAETPAQWSAAVGRLAHDPLLRRRMGHAARQRVQADFSTSAGASRWLNLLADLERKREAA